MELLADVEFSTEGLAIIGFLLAALTAAIGVLWKEDRRRLNDQVADLRKQRDDLLRLAFRAGLADRIPESVPHEAIPPPRHRDDPTPPPRG